MGNREKSERIASGLIAMLLDDAVDLRTKEMIRVWFWSRVSRDAKDTALLEQFRNMVSNPMPTAEDHRKFAELAERLDIDDVDISVVQRRRRSFSRFLARPVGIAASLFLFLGISGAVWLWVDNYGGSIERQLAVRQVTVTGEYPEHAVSLPDGSVVTLGQDATISYGADFEGDRVVTLTGQAIFDVAKAMDEAGMQRPFSVQTDNLEVLVRGTVFNVDASANSPVSRIALYEGAVHIHSGEITTELRPGEVLSHDNHTKSNTLSLVPAEEMIRHGFKPLLRFDSSNLAEVMLSLEANFGVRFVLPRGIDVGQEAISADFEGLSLHDIVRALSITDKQHSYNLSGDTITITNKKTILDE